MPTPVVSDKVKTLAKDLTQDYPRSPRAVLGGYVLAARALDKCRAELNGTIGEYDFNCPLDKRFFEFAEINADEFQVYIAEGHSDDEVGEWIKTHAKQKDREEVVVWNNQCREMHISHLPPANQIYIEDYIAQNIPSGKVIYRLFDMLDAEEGRI